VPEDPQDALVRLERTVAKIEELPEGPERQRALELLDAVDAAHRALVWHVAERIWTENAPLFERLLKEDVAGILFEMYGLVAPERTGAPAEAGASGFVALGDLERTLPVKPK
jgi:hypothetical protein